MDCSNEVEVKSKVILRSGIHFDQVLNVKEDSSLIRYCLSTEILYDGSTSLLMGK